MKGTKTRRHKRESSPLVIGSSIRVQALLVLWKVEVNVEGAYRVVTVFPNGEIVIENIDGIKFKVNGQWVKNNLNNVEEVKFII